MTDDTLTKLAYEVDDFIASMVEKHHLDPLTLGSCILARLTLINQHVGSGDDFKELLLRIPDIKSKNIEVMH